MQKYGITHLDGSNGSKDTMIVYTSRLNNACVALRKIPETRISVPTSVRARDSPYCLSFGLSC